MSGPVSSPTPYDHAAALACRLKQEMERGAVLLLDGAVAVIGFTLYPETKVIGIRCQANTACVFYGVAWADLSPDAFDAYWHGRIKVLRESAWPEGDEQEPLTWAEIKRDLRIVERGLRKSDCAVDEQAVVSAADRLARVCRELGRKGDQG